MQSICSNMKIRSFIPLLISLTVIVCIASSAVVSSRKIFVWNSTASMPEGLYYLTHKDTINCGDIVYFPIPDNVRGLVIDERKWLDKDCCLMKRVAAVENDFVCVNGASLQIRYITGPVSSLDSLGRTLPSISFCGHLGKGQLFVGDISNPRSFDSRYFGPVNIDQVIGTAIPIWTF